MNAKRSFFNIAVKVWYIIAFFLVLMAVLILISRAITPMLNHSKHFFEDKTSKYIGMPVAISHLRADFQGLEPDLKFEGVDIYAKDRSKILLHVNTLEININLIHSLLEKTIKPNYINISGINAKINQLQNHQFALEGFSNQNTDNKTNDGWILWILNQPKITLNSANIQLSLESGQTIPLNINNLHLENSAFTHHCFGQISIQNQQKQLPTQISFGVLLRGNANQLDQSKILAYAQIQNGFCRQLAFNKIFKGYTVQQGIVNGQVWLSFQNQQIQSVQSLLNINNLQLASDKKTINIPTFSGNFLWENAEDGWKLSGDNIGLKTGSVAWLKNKLLISAYHQNNVSFQNIYLARLDISNTKKWLVDNQMIPKNINTLLAKTAPSGSLTHLEFRHQGNWDVLNNYYFGSLFSAVNLNAYHAFPGAENLSGAIECTDQGGSLKVSSTDSSLDFSFYENPLFFDSINGTLTWNHDLKGNWTITSPLFSVSSNDLALHTQAEFFIPSKHPEKTTMNIQANYQLNSADVAKNYIPTLVLDENLNDWLNQAFYGNTPLTGTTVIQGRMSNFPFDKDPKGTFMTNVKLQGINLHYDSAWPDLKNITGNLVFNKRSMQVDVDHATIAGAEVAHVQGVIPYLGHQKTPPELTVNSTLNTDAKQLVQFINNSPLKNSVGAGLKSLIIQGKMGLNLHLFIPLDKAPTVKVNGDLNFPSVNLNIPSQQIQINKLTGNIVFTENSVSSKNLTGILLNEPTHFQFNLLDKQKLQIALDSQIEMASLINYLKWKNIAYLQGKTAYHAVLTINLSSDASIKNNFSAHSDLLGIQINLPDPLGKKEKQIKPFDFQLNFGNNQPMELFLKMQNELNAAISIKENPTTHVFEFFSGNISVGNKKADIQNQPGWYVTGDLPVLNQPLLQSWQTFIEKNKSPAGQTIQSNIKNKIKSIALRVGLVDLFNLQFKNALISLIPDVNAWKIHIDCPDINGDLLIPDDYPKTPLTGQFSNLTLNTNKSSLTTLSKTNPGAIPAMHLTIGQLIYNQKPLGAFDLKMHPENKILWIDNSSFNSPLLTGTVTGKWQLLNNNTYSTHLTGTLQSNDIETLLQKNAVQSGLIAKTGGLTFDITWPDSIERFEIIKTTGHVSVQLGSGWLIDLGNQASNKLNLGRLITLLSVGNINRLFTMNFSDLTHKGYGFDKMIGDFDLDQGNITTNNLSFEGVVAHIGVKGQIHAVKKTLDLMITVEPHLTSSLPAVATIVGGPIVGAVTWAANKVVGNMVSRQLVHYQYQVTGSFAKPIIKSLTS